MRLTLGEEEALTHETISQTLSRVTSEITKEESERLSAEQNSHRQTQERLRTQLFEQQQIQQRLYWRCAKSAKKLSWGIAVFVSIFLLLGIAAGLGLTSSNPIIGWFLLGCSVLIGFVGIVDIMIGFSVREMRDRCEQQILTWLLKREAAVTGITLGEAGNDNIL